MEINGSRRVVKTKKAAFLSKTAFVRAEGLEPPCLSAPDPKSGTSTNFATPGSFPNSAQQWFNQTGRKNRGIDLCTKSSLLYQPIIRIVAAFTMGCTYCYFVTSFQGLVILSSAFTFAVLLFTDSARLRFKFRQVLATHYSSLTSSTHQV